MKCFGQSSKIKSMVEKNILDYRNNIKVCNYQYVEKFNNVMNEMLMCSDLQRSRSSLSLERCLLVGGPICDIKLVYDFNTHEYNFGIPQQTQKRKKYCDDGAIEIDVSYKDKIYNVIGRGAFEETVTNRCFLEVDKKGRLGRRASYSEFSFSSAKRDYEDSSSVMFLENL